MLRTLLARQRAGTRLVYIPGNHDASLAMLAQMLQGQFEVHREWVHRTARGARLLVLHGDQFDAPVHLPAAGSPTWATCCTRATVQVSNTVNNLRRALGKPYWPLTEALKLGIGTSARFIENFEAAGRGPRPRPRLRRGDLRAHPSCKPARHRRHHLCQHRGLG